MPAYSREKHFNQGAKEVVFLLGDAEYPQRATLGLMQRIEGRFGPAVALMGRLAQHNATVAETAELLGLILRDHKTLPKGAALLEAIEPVGLIETQAACVAWLRYGLSSDMPPPAGAEDEAGNA